MPEHRKSIHGKSGGSSSKSSSTAVSATATSGEEVAGTVPPTESVDKSTPNSPPIPSSSDLSQSTAAAASADNAPTNMPADAGEGGQPVVAADRDRSNSFQVLCHDRVRRLHEVMESQIPICPRQPDYPVLYIQLKALVQAVRDKLIAEQIPVKDIRMNGGAATCIVGLDPQDNFNDLDLIFAVDISNNAVSQKIKSTVLHCLSELLTAAAQEKVATTSTQSLPTPAQDCTNNSACPKFTDYTVKELYIPKMVRIFNPNNPNSDSWSLIALGHLNPAGVGKTVELKFVERMRRQFEFTVDSFQIILDSLLTFYEVSAQGMSDNFYPTVVAESVAGSFQDALDHLNYRIIATRNPEEIRGGGLLKYCKLLVDNYRPADNIDILSMERYMCSRFFIDFPDLVGQRCKLESYLANHFGSQEEIKAVYLQTLHEVVQHSTVCLMTHERRQTLYLISILLQQVMADIALKNSVVHLEEFSSQNWALDQVFYGTAYFPQHVYLPTPGSGGGAAYPMPCPRSLAPLHVPHTPPLWSCVTISPAVRFPTAVP